MIINFLSQIVLFMLFMVIVHGCWTYVQENVIKKKTEMVTPSQIQKYEKMIDDLQQQNVETNKEELPADTMEEDLENYVNSLL